MIYYDDVGIRKSEGELLEDGITAHGRWVFWHANGQVMQEGEYDKGAPVGLWVYFREDGTKRAEGHFQSGKKTGFWQHWQQNGSLETAGAFIDGNEDGLWQCWNADGIISSQGAYKNGKRHGAWYFNADSPDGGYITEWYMGKLTTRLSQPPDQPTEQASWYYPVVPGQLDGHHTPFDRQGPCSGLYFGCLDSMRRFTYLFKPVTAFTFHDPAGLCLVINERYTYLWVLEKCFSAAPGMPEPLLQDADCMEEGTFIVITNPVACALGTKPHWSEHSLLRDAVRQCSDTAQKMNVRTAAGLLIRRYPLDI